MICYVPLKTLVVNLRDEEFDVYIGRAGRGWNGYFGNPFRRTPMQRPGDTLKRFEEHFLERVEKDREFRRRVLELRGKRLGCFCKPNPCHGDVIAKWLNEQPIECRHFTVDVKEEDELSLNPLDGYWRRCLLCGVAYDRSAFLVKLERAIRDRNRLRPLDWYEDD
jgi:hypothetical protein